MLYPASTDIVALDLQRMHTPETSVRPSAQAVAGLKVLVLDDDVEDLLDGIVVVVKLEDGVELVVELGSDGACDADDEGDDDELLVVEVVDRACDADGEGDELLVVGDRTTLTAGHVTMPRIVRQDVIVVVVWT